MATRSAFALGVLAGWLVADVAVALKRLDARREFDHRPGVSRDVIGELEADLAVALNEREDDLHMIKEMGVELQELENRIWGDTAAGLDAESALLVAGPHGVEASAERGDGGCKAGAAYSEGADQGDEFRVHLDSSSVVPGAGNTRINHTVEAAGAAPLTGDSSPSRRGADSATSSLSSAISDRLDEVADMLDRITGLLDLIARNTRPPGSTITVDGSVRASALDARRTAERPPTATRVSAGKPGTPPPSTSESGVA